jgi:hypothetical protein
MTFSDQPGSRPLWVHGRPSGLPSLVTLSAFSRGECSGVRRGEINLLIINLPPRSLKSLIVSVAFPAFVLG